MRTLRYNPRPLSRQTRPSGGWLVRLLVVQHDSVFANKEMTKPVYLPTVHLFSWV